MKNFPLHLSSNVNLNLKIDYDNQFVVTGKKRTPKKLKKKVSDQAVKNLLVFQEDIKSSRFQKFKRPTNTQTKHSLELLNAITCKTFIEFMDKKGTKTSLEDANNTLQGWELKNLSPVQEKRMDKFLKCLKSLNHAIENSEKDKKIRNTSLGAYSKAARNFNDLWNDPSLFSDFDKLTYGKECTEALKILNKKAKGL